MWYPAGGDAIERPVMIDAGEPPTAFLSEAHHAAASRSRVLAA
jgi:hypothetical protein